MKPYPSQLIFGRYYTRKDFHHKASGFNWAFYPKKKIRKNAESRLRNYKREVSNGGWYKKVFDLKWIIF